MTTAAAPIIPDCTKLFVNGEWVESASGKTYENENPARKKSLGTVAIADAQDVNRAVAAARAALAGPWATKMSPADRGRLLWKIADQIRSHADELATLESLDTGKPFLEARRGDMMQAADCFEYYAGWATKLTGETVPVPGRFFDYTRREPVGVVGAIVPWNFPLQMAANKVAPALAMGNTVILKPAEQTPLTAILLAKIAQELELPAGVLNVLPGFGDTGEAMVVHPGIDKISFTGSTAVGKRIIKQAADTLKRVTLELGGKSPNIVFADADVQKAIRGVTTGVFYNQGQMCTAGSRVLVERGIYDAFLAAFTAAVAGISVGDPFAKETRMGSLVSAEQLERVSGYVSAGKAEGAMLVHAGEPPAGLEGHFHGPTIFADVRSDMRIAREEIFGPVVAIIPFENEAEALQIANDTSYGLASGIWTNDLTRAHRVAHALKAGTVWVNTYNAMWNEAPFGGYKESGTGREGGRQGAEIFTEVKNVCIML